MSDVDPEAVEPEAPDAQVEESDLPGDDFDWQDFLADYYGDKKTDEPVEQTSEPAEGEPEPVAAEEASPTPAPSEPDIIEIAGRRIPASEADRVGALYDFIQQYPAEAAQFGAYLVGEMDIVPKGSGPGQAAPPTTPEPPAPVRQPLRDDDLEYLPEPVRDRIKQIDEYEQRFAQIDQTLGAYAQVAQQQYEQVNLERARAAQGAINTGSEQFKNQYDLSDEDIGKLIQEAADLGVTAHLAEKYNDPVRAVTESLELAYLRNPEYRDREFARFQEAATAQQKKDRKLGAISGSGGSVTRSSTPSTPEEKRAAMVREIGDAMNGRAS